MSTKKHLLPPNIHAHPKGLIVRVKRGEVIYKAFVAKGDPDALQKALVLRDGFLALAGPRRRFFLKARSNTGIPGISESVWWSHNKPYDCFSVSWRNPRPRKRRIIYRSWSDRERALREAIALRRRMVGAPEPILEDLNV